MLDPMIPNSTHLPFNHIMAMLDAEMFGEAAVEAAKAVAAYIPEVSNYAVDPKAVNAAVLDRALYRLYSSGAWPGHIKALGLAVWPAHPRFI